MAQTVRVHLQCRKRGFDPWVGKIPWRFPWTEEPGGLQSMVSQLDMTEQLTQTRMHAGMSTVCGPLIISSRLTSQLFLPVSEEN